MAAKVLLVEDDNNLREIYEARLMAEGYNIVTARDGEEALTVAKAETPDLVISDVMMPRVSGFEMLDILRNTESLKDVKVIMLTALGQADDKTRANSLGADRYLVKSQVTLEDIVKTAHELLEGAATQVTPASPAPAPAAAAPAAPSVVPPAPQPVAPAPVAPVPPVVQPVAPTPVAPSVMPAPVTPAPPVMPDPAAPPMPGAPVPAPTMAPPVPSQPVAPPVAPSVDEERASIGAQINNFVAGAPVPAPASAAAQDDAVLATAMHDLAASSATPPTPEPPAPVVVPPSPSQPVAPPQPPMESMPETSVPAPSPTAVSGSVTIANKKIIQPLGGSEAKPNIHELMAREEASGIATNNAVGHVPPAPATTISPNGPAPAAPAPAAAPVVDGQPTAPPLVQPQPPKPNDFDPNNISL